MKHRLTLMLAIIAANVAAQDKPSNDVHRTGFVFGISAGPTLVHLDFSEHHSIDQFSFSMPNMKIGWMVSDRMAVLLSLPGSVYSYTVSGRKRDRGFEAIVPSAQYWTNDRCWLLAGIGLGMDAPAFYDIKNETERTFYFGGAAIAAAGYEILQRNKFTIDLQARMHVGTANRPEGVCRGVSGEILLGVNWY